MSRMNKLKWVEEPVPVAFMAMEPVPMSQKEVFMKRIGLLSQILTCSDRSLPSSRNVKGDSPMSRWEMNVGWR
ncbi:hypothetical protein CQJ30_17265 [Caldibacillus thermoamylovorans]|nr:hypothetical protein CQJ30_17265 [Caldibacillus thermoamylovorans]